MKQHIDEVLMCIGNVEIEKKITQILRSQFQDVDCICIVHTLKEALEQINRWDKPLCTLVFMELDVLRSVAHTLAKINASGAVVDTVLVLENPDFFALQEALRLGIADCLLYPFTADEVAMVLEGIGDLMQNRDRSIPAEASSASRYLLWRSDIKKLHHTHMTVAQINMEYGTFFAEGLYRAIFVEMANRSNPTCVVDNHELQDMVMRIINLQVRKECFDVLFNRHSNGVSALLNYAAGKRSTLDHLVDQLFFSLRREMEQLYHVEITMSIGRIYSELSMLPEAKQEILDARWLRKQLGSGRIINAEDIGDTPISETLMHKILNDRDLIFHYFELLDAKQATACLRTLMQDCRENVPRRELRIVLRDCMDFLFHNYSNELQSYGDPEALRHNYISREVTAQNILNYEETIIENFQDMMQKIAVVLRRQYSRPIKECMSYIAQRHCKDIRLNNLAELVHLSPQYLSSMFHRETGLSVSEYIIAEKMNLAKIMLTHGDQNISEVANFLGFHDARYFSKFFKAHQGVTPTDFRKMKQAVTQRMDQNSKMI